MYQSKFNKLFNLVMQSFNQDWDRTEAYGRSAYNLREFDRQNKQLMAKSNGQVIIDPQYECPVYWEVVAAHYPGYDMITGERFPENTVVFSYKPSQAFSEKTRKYVLFSTYENQDPMIQEKLMSVGLEPGFKYEEYNMAMEEK